MWLYPTHVLFLRKLVKRLFHSSYSMENKVLHRLLFRWAGPAVLRQTKESINPFDERVCHSVTTSTERLRSNLTAKGLSCTQDNRLYCMCVWDGVSVCVFIGCMCEVSGGGKSTISLYHCLSLATDVHMLFYPQATLCGLCLWLNLHGLFCEHWVVDILEK